MVNPIYIIIIALGVSFLLGAISKKMVSIQYFLMIASLTALTVISAGWSYNLLFNGIAPLEILTAGFKPPFSINLLMGKNEAVFTLLINFAGLLGSIYLFDLFKKQGRNTIIIFLVFIMSLNVVVMTRDIFNLFVFLEVASIATAGLIFMDENDKALSAGFKYIIATAVISGLFLLGIIFAYYFTGSLNLKDLIAFDFSTVKEASIAVYLIIIALTLELKPFPANGWGIDVYETVNPGVAAVIAAASTSAIYFALSKVMLIAGDGWYSLVAIIGIITFVGSNLLGVKQTNDRRMLGYSSVGQMGLLLVILGFSPILGDKKDLIVYGIIVSHYLAKAGLFWISGIVNSSDLKGWASIRRNPLLLVLLGTFIFALIGFPPFPAFFAKWEFIMLLAKDGSFIWSALILLGSFFEAIYLFRWFGYALKLENSDLPELKTDWFKILPPLVFGLLIYAAGYYAGNYLDGAKGINYIPLLFIAAIGLLDFLPAWVKNTISIVGVSIYTYYIFPQFEGDLFRSVFGGLFLGGAILTLFSGYYAKGRRAGFFPMALAMFAGLTLLVEAENLLQLLYGWELMAIGSYFLLIRGKKSMPHGFSYMLFSIGGSYAMMFGFSLAFASSGNISIEALKGITILPELAYSLMLLGFLTKTASVGLHIWLPGAHGEAVADIHFMASAILLKAGVFGIILVLLGMGTDAYYAKPILFALGWIGALSALLGNISAIFQESAKRLLAWSSIGQLGYIIFGLATMTHLGWLSAISYSITHFLYKGILFLVVGGIALKLGTPYMYKMGGLIKKMPFSYIAVLIAIITLSGVPPLVGFTGKWIFYNLIISEGYYFSGFVVLIAGMIAFLYLFRLIHTIFLGQLKDEHRNAKEISVWLLIPVYVLIAIIMYTSIFPNTLLKPIGDMLVQYFPNGGINWDGSMGTTALGYFNGTIVMNVSGGLFVVLFAWLLFINRKTKKIKQFNIGFAAEAPSRPEETHFAYNFFAPYQKALGFLAMPLVTNFWNSIADSIHAVADFLRRLFYGGNGQSYLVQIVLFMVTFYLLGVK